jgi:hypothetical protein
MQMPDRAVRLDNGAGAEPRQHDAHHQTVGPANIVGREGFQIEAWTTSWPLVPFANPPPAPHAHPVWFRSRPGQFVSGSFELMGSSLLLLLARGRSFVAVSFPVVSTLVSWPGRPLPASGGPDVDG